MAVAVDGDAVGLAVPGADRRLQVADEVVRIDLRLHPVGHLVEQALAGSVALERRAHLDDVEIDGAGGDRLLQAGVVVGLRQVDPVDLGAGVGLPRLQEAAKQQVVQVLVVESHEGQLDAGELPLGHIGLGGAEAHLADLLPVGIGGRALAHSGDLQDLGAQIVLGAGGAGERAECATGGQRQRPGTGRALQDRAPAGLGRHQPLVVLHFHSIILPGPASPRPTPAQIRSFF